MYAKIIIVSLLPITLARHILYGRPGFWTHVDPGRQFHFRNPDSVNFGVGPVTPFNLYGANFGEFRPYPEENHGTLEHYERHVDHNTNPHSNVQQTNGDVRNIEQSGYRNSDYQIQNGHRKDSQRRDNRDESYYTNDAVNSNQSGNQRRHQDSSNVNHSRERPATIDSIQDNRQHTLKTNIDSQTSTHSESPSDERTNYHLENVTMSSNDPKEYGVRTNDGAKSVSPVTIDQSSVIQPSVTEKSTARGGDPQGSRDNLPEVNGNGDSMIFLDNPKPITSVKTTTDNEVSINKNARNEEEEWVWTESQPTTTIAPTNKPPPSKGELDDRVSFAGDGCPKGEAKVLGQCVKQHKKM